MTANSSFVKRELFQIRLHFWYYEEKQYKGRNYVSAIGK
ncbi:hypothetical protein BSBH6_00978 [Bacillus subtilis]|nr:hypothetical protein BSBH6_00978 [Bacillus subtilis]RPK27339.1 hypothetical protein BH5_00975 [Bacillus subtilis]